MSNVYQEFAVKMAEAIPQPEDYTGEDGLLYCGKCVYRNNGIFQKV